MTGEHFDTRGYRPPLEWKIRTGIDLVDIKEEGKPVYNRGERSVMLLGYRITGRAAKEKVEQGDSREVTTYAFDYEYVSGHDREASDRGIATVEEDNEFDASKSVLIKLLGTDERNEQLRRTA